MAITQSQSAKSNAPPQHESFVEQELVRASRRQRGLDFSAWLMVFASIILGYGLLMSFADRLWNLPTGLRLALWCLFVLALVVFVGIAVSRLYLQQVNPHFIARQLEQTVPDAKNSVINWLDLRSQPLAQVIRSSLGRRAAKDLTHANAERAISARPVWWCGSILALLALLQLGWLISAPGPVMSLLQRAFFPFDKASIANSTELKMVQPETGDTSVLANQPVVIRVQADGYVPALNRKDSLKLHFRYHQNEQFEERSLLPDVDGTWMTTVHADQVRNGFWYKITGGDARLPADREFRVDVRQLAQVLQFEGGFKYRDYLRFQNKYVTFPKNVRPNILEMRGTEVTLTVHTNRILKDCFLDLKSGNSRKTLAGEPVKGDDDAWRFTWLLDQSGEFRVLFESKNGEQNVDREPCKFEVIPDKAPIVVMTKPAKDIVLPANGTLTVEGFTTDDFGVKSMQLCLKVLKAPTMPQLQPKFYRPDTKFQLVNGKYPLKLDYSDFLALDSLNTTGNQPFPLAAGMELEYWLEARDNCDYPNKNGNLGQSARFKLTIQPPETNKEKTAQDRKKAEQETQQNQKQQDKSLDDQNQVAQAQTEAAGGGGKQQQNDEKLDKQKKQVKDALKNADEKSDAKGAGEGKDEPKDKGQKDNPANAGKSKDEQPEKDKQKDPGEKGQDTKPGQAKDQGGDPGSDQKTGQGAGKDEGKRKQGNEQPGAAKKNDDKSKPGNDSAAGEAKKTPDEKQDNNSQPKDSQAGDSLKGQSKKNNPDEQPDQTSKDSPSDLKASKASAKIPIKDAPSFNGEGANAKDGKPTTDGDSADSKQGSPKFSQEAGKGKTGDRKGATSADVDKLKELLTDPEQRKAAEKALDKIADQAEDRQVSDAAEKALKDLMNGESGQAKEGNQRPGPASEKTAPKDTEPGKLPKEAKSTQQKDDFAKSKEDLAKSNELAKGNADKTENNNFGKDKPKSSSQDAPANPVDEAAARRAGELQLESLKKQIDKLRDKFTPQVMKELNWTDKDRDDFLRRLQADALLRAQQQKNTTDKSPAIGSVQSQLPGSGPRLLQPDPRNNDSQVNGSRPDAPPDVREALKLLQKK